MQVDSVVGPGFHQVWMTCFYVLLEVTGSSLQFIISYLHGCKSASSINFTISNIFFQIWWLQRANRFRLALEYLWILLAEGTSHDPEPEARGRHQQPGGGGWQSVCGLYRRHDEARFRGQSCELARLPQLVEECRQGQGRLEPSEFWTSFRVAKEALISNLSAV